MQVESFLERSSERYPNKVALICGGHRMTYREVDQQANRLAHSLISSGIQRGDRVAVYLDNSVEAVISIFAILKAGGVFLVINPTTKADKLSYILSNCRSSGLVIPTSKLQAVSNTIAAAPYLKGLWSVEESDGVAVRSPISSIALNSVVKDASYSAEAPAKKCIDIDLAALIYTSGSTGRPKGVMLTHLNILSAAESICTYLENTAEDVILDVLPLSFDYGLYQVLMAFRMGATIVLERSFTYPYEVIETILREKITGLPIVPTISSMLLQLDLTAVEFPHLRYITNTAAALPTEHIRKLRVLFPSVKVYSMYGLTECKRVSYLPPDQIDVRPTSVGRGMPNEEVFIVNEDGQKVGPGIIGELVVRGSNVMKGYWELPEETRNVLKPGLLPEEKVLYTGDLFRMDDEGYLYFIGRKDDIIKSRGEKVSPREVEEVLYKLDAVFEAAVVGVPDEVLGQEIRAVIVVRPGTQLTEKEVLKHCSAHLESFMVPKSVVFQQSLPRTDTGKISKRRVVEPLVAEL